MWVLPKGAKAPVQTAQAAQWNSSLTYVAGRVKRMFKMAKEFLECHKIGKQMLQKMYIKVLHSHVLAAEEEAAQQQLQRLFCRQQASVAMSSASAASVSVDRDPSADLDSVMAASGLHKMLLPMVIFFAPSSVQNSLTAGDEPETGIETHCDNKFKVQ
jgi:hypothetical protein